MAVLTNFLKLLKPEKNDYVDVDKHISENYDKIDAEFSKIDTKFKNYPVPIGGILLMYNSLNPAELYPNTTWELLATDKYLKTGNTPLQQGGSNSFTIQKANLPAVKVQLESFSVVTQAHIHKIPRVTGYSNNANEASTHSVGMGFVRGISVSEIGTKNGGGDNTGTASPYTQNLGNGTAITVNPTYITIRAWKRLT